MDKHCAACVAGVLSVALPLFAERDLRWDTAAARQLALRCNGEDVWRFHFDPAKETKPYFDPVCVAGEPSLTWARPPDHVWHYGLWFSWKFINGVNYWEEKDARSAGETFWEAPDIETGADGSARIALRLGYRPTPSDEPVMSERRTVAISAPGADGSYLMDWTQVFAAGSRPVTLDRTPLPGEPDGKAWGGYAGLSVRLAKAFTNLETVASTVGRVPRDKAGRLDVSAAAAEQSGLVGGKSYGVAILAHPSNPRAPGEWYPIENPAAPFYYLNAAFLLKAAWVMQPGETLTLRYRVCVHPGRWDAEALRRASARYADDVSAALRKQLAEAFGVKADAAGQRVVEFKTKRDQALVNGLELLGAGSAREDTRPPPAAAKLEGERPREPLAPGPGQLSVLLLAGANNHNWQETTAALQAIFAGAPKFFVRVEESPWDMKPADLEGCDLIFNNWNTYGKDKREWTAEMKAAFMAWVKKGGGFFVLHAGGSMFYDWDEFQALTGGAWEKGTFHPHRQSFTVNIADKTHPATRGMADFETFDEPWQRIANRNPKRRVLLTGVVSKENKGSGEPEPFAFVTELGKGRCFNLVLGHDGRALSNAGCRTLILRGAEWAATGDVK